ncbi:MAG: hypothetical protein ACLR0N_13695 [Bilophila wadsworthia]
MYDHHAPRSRPVQRHYHNGAGGPSSSIGEMAEDTNGCHRSGPRAPQIRRPAPVEILLPKRGAHDPAVPRRSTNSSPYKRMDVEATPLGEFTDDGVFHVTHSKLVTHLDIIHARRRAPVPAQRRMEAPVRDSASRRRRRGSGELSGHARPPEHCREHLIRQYDHEVKGGSVVKPLTGVKRDGPSDAGVIRPILESEAGLVISHGICPKYSDYDAYWMMANAMDEGIRNAVAVGADPDRMAGVDNFCWCDPVQSEKTPDGEYKLAQLCAPRPLEFCVAYGALHFRQDSMKNDHTGGGKKIPFRRPSSSPSSASWTM